MDTEGGTSEASEADAEAPQGSGRSPTPPPLPTPPPPLPPTAEDELEKYNTMAETVGGVPSLRLWDNLAQLAGGIIGAVIGAVIGALMYGMGGAVAGLFLGFIAFVLIGGFVLMIVGWMRLRRKAERRRQP